ncbi:hypothetical protein CEXT_783171 [Caerostris extrusa]|uniref:Ribosomal protein S14 n=1 Tax=Caerostris extrusa TaxID=172846 RepID=A0AAV4XXC2_CAEEX|nr:hypothetical protein CEXT_783171 [Caerostris extrusa]
MTVRRKSTRQKKKRNALKKKKNNSPCHLIKRQFTLTAEKSTWFLFQKCRNSASEWQRNSVLRAMLKNRDTVLSFVGRTHPVLKPCSSGYICGGYLWSFFSQLPSTPRNH